MLRRYKIRKKAKIAIELLKEYFKDRDEEIYCALCNCKRRDIIIAKKEYVDNYVCDEFDFVVMDKQQKVIASSFGSRIEKIYANNPIELINVVNFHELLELDNYTMCTWDMIIDYLKKVNS